jgi:hypothetical protein
MKKILNILFSLGLVSTSWAQTAQPAAIDTGANFRNELLSRGKVSFGITQGLSFSSLYGKEIGYVFAGNTADYAVGNHLGLIVNNRISKNFWLKHELFYNRRVTGVQLYDSINGRYDSKLKLIYLELQPANTTFHLKGFQVYAGPYISALLDAHIARKDINGNLFNDHNIFGTPDNNESESKYLQKFDFGINAGVEYLLPIGLSIGAKYTHGLTDIFQYANSYTLGDTKNDNIKIYNRGFMISIGFVFK